MVVADSRSAASSPLDDLLKFIHGLQVSCSRISSHPVIHLRDLLRGSIGASKLSSVSLSALRGQFRLPRIVSALPVIRIQALAVPSTAPKPAEGALHVRSGPRFP